MKDLCICCGEAIPEGRQVCPICEANAINKIPNPRGGEEMQERSDTHDARRSRP